MQGLSSARIMAMNSSTFARIFLIAFDNRGPMLFAALQSVELITLAICNVGKVRLKEVRDCFNHVYKTCINRTDD